MAHSLKPTRATGPSPEPRERSRGRSAVAAVWQAVSVSGWNTSDLLTPPLCRCVSAGSCVGQFFALLLLRRRHRKDLLFVLLHKKQRKSFFFFPLYFLSSSFLRLRDRKKRWCSHAHQRPGWRYFQQPSPQPAAELLPPPLAATVKAGWPGATTVRGTQVLARTAQARATIAGTFSAAEREAATKPRPFPLCGWREGGEEGKLLPKVMPCAPQMCTGNFLGTVTR